MFPLVFHQPSYRCCMFVSCVHPVAVLNAAFCMICSLLMLVEDAIGDHTEEVYSRAGLITALYVAMSVSFCLHHPVVVSAFVICRGVCACTEMLWMYVQYVSFGSKVRPRTFGCVAMGSVLLFIVGSRLLESGVNTVQVVLSGFSKRLFCFVQAKTLCRYGCMYFLAALVLVCVDVSMMSLHEVCVGHDVNRCTEWW